MKRFCFIFLSVAVLFLIPQWGVLAAITDPAGNTPSNTPYTSGEEYEIDRDAPTVVGINLLTGTPTNASTVIFEVTFSEAVTGAGLDDFSLNVTGVTGASIQSVTGSGTTYTLTVSTGSGSGTIALVIPSEATIQDDVGNSLDGLPITSADYVIDKISPETTLTGYPPSYANQTSATFLFNATDDGGAGVAYTECKLDTGSWEICTSPYEVSDLSAGEHTFAVRATDAASNVDSTPASYTWTIDTGAPTVVSITRLGTSPTNASQVQFSVVFSEAVIDVDAADFALTTTGGITGASIAEITGTGETRTVTVNTGTKDGTIRLDVSDTATITDLAGTGISNKPYTGDESYTIDKTLPQVVSIVRGDPNPTNAQSVTFIVTFSEPVVGVTPDVFTLTTSGTIQGAYIVSVTGSGTTYTVTVNTGTGSGTIRLDVTP
ncbi:MAG: Fibronectin type III domain protein [Anaerolineae bacterium]|nr:MAG: Fibronectin type III domain protein [Anaerolineae bacterium]